MNYLSQKEAFKLMDAGVRVQIDDAGGGWHDCPSLDITIAERTSYRIKPDERFLAVKVMVDPPPACGWVIPVALLNGSIEEQVKDSATAGDVIYLGIIEMTGKEWNEIEEFDGY